MRRLAKGTKLEIGDGASEEQFVAVAQLTKVGFPGFTRGKIDVSDHDTVDLKEYLQEALADVESFPIAGHWDPNNATHDESTGLFALSKSGETRNMRIVGPNSLYTLSFAGFVSRFKPGDADHDGKITFEGEVTVNGDLQLA